MSNDKWTRRAKWIVSCAVTVLFMVFISSIIIDTMQVTKLDQEIPDNPLTESNVQISNSPDDRIVGLPIEKAIVFDLLEIEGYEPTMEDVPEIPSDCDSEVLARTISDTVGNLSGGAKVVLNLEHQMLRDLPAPSIVWISNYEDSYPVVFLYQDNETVTISDPSRDKVNYSVKEFGEIYRKAGSQSVYITDRGYVIE